MLDVPIDTIRKLEINDGDVLVLDVQRFLSPMAISQLRNQLHAATSGKNLSIIVCDRDTTVGTIDETVMNDLGWYRKTA